MDEYSGWRAVVDLLAARPVPAAVAGLLVGSTCPRSPGFSGPAPSTVDEWLLALRLAAAHGILPALAATVASGQASPVPERIAAHLAHVRNDAVTTDRATLLVLGEVLDRFSRAGIPAMLLKGTGIGERLFADPARRVSKDIDLLVQKADVDGAGEVLRKIGLLPQAHEYYRSHHFHLPWFHPRRTVARWVELHWDVTPAAYPVRFDIDRWWREARPYASRAGDVLLPPALDEAVYVALHAAWSGASRLRELSDVAGLWNLLPPGAQAGWKALAEERGAIGFAGTGLSLANAFWPLSDPGRELPGIEAAMHLPRRVRPMIAPASVLRYGDRLWWALQRVTISCSLPRGGVRWDPQQWTDPAGDGEHGGGARGSGSWRLRLAVALAGGVALMSSFARRS